MEHVKEKIWKLMMDAFTNYRYADLISNKFKKINHYSQTVLTLIAIVSAAAWFVGEKGKLFTAVVFVLSQIGTIVLPYYNFWKKEYIYSEIKDECLVYFKSVEQLWTELERDIISERFALDEFYKLNQQRNKSSHEYDIVINDHPRLRAKAESDCYKYATKYN